LIIIFRHFHGNGKLAGDVRRSTYCYFARSSCLRGWE